MAMLLRLVVIATAAAAVFVNMAVAVNYDVGAPDGGWDLNTSLQAWANNITFMEGDTITFVYGPTSHSVLEVAKTDYDGCLTNASISSDSSGKTVISLNSIGNRYFICGTPTHCDRGMKVVITTVATPAPPPGTPSVPPAPTPSSPSPATPSGSPPAVSPVSSPVASPPPKTATPANSPKVPPSVSPSKSPSKIPASSPPAPPAESPASPPSLSTPPSSANKINVVTGLTAGVGFIIVMLHTL